jgi:hypothetical protein
MSLFCDSADSKGGTDMNQTVDPISCRFCGAEADFVFRHKVMEGLDVRYHRCRGCDSLLTEQPTWLEHVYSNPTRPTDTSAARRAERCKIVIFWLWKLFRMSSSDQLLDWGGGDGLLVRMLRDEGIDAYRYDTYTKNSYALGFDGDPDKSYSMVTAFEVWEHFVDARAEVDQLFARQPKVLLLSTSLYDGQDQSWSYIESGRHVFFWSRTALKQVAETYGYRPVIGRSQVLFYRPHLLGPIRRRMVRAFMSLKGMTIKQIAWLLWPKQSLTQCDRQTSILREKRES